MILHIILSSIFVVSIVALVIIGIKIATTYRTITPRQAIRMFEKLDQQQRRR